MGKNNCKQRKEERRAQAEHRNQQFASKNPLEKQLHLDQLLGKNKGAIKQRIRLLN